MKTMRLNTHSARPLFLPSGASAGRVAKGLGLLFTVAAICFNSSYMASGQYAAGTVIPPGYVQLEGDVITTEADAAVLLGTATSRGAYFAFAPSRLWPNRIVPFEFDSNVSAQQQTVFLAAMAMWTNSFPGVATITFQPRNGEAGYVHLMMIAESDAGGSTDYVGYSGGRVTIEINTNSLTTGVIAHELGHALGLWHEQSRDDRDAYVAIVWDNIASGESDQFSKKTPESTFGSYDYGSIMHYKWRAFSKCTNAVDCTDTGCITIQVALPYAAQQCKIGQRIQPSPMDKRAMAFRYAPPDWRFLYSKSGSASLGTLDQPYITLSQATDGIPASGTLWLGPGAYLAAGQTISKPMTLRAALPDLQLQADGSLGPSPAGYATLR
jgi:hypothetical protein